MIERLFPAAYDDDEAAGEFRELTENDLRDERLSGLPTCAEDSRPSSGDVTA